MRRWAAGRFAWGRNEWIAGATLAAVGIPSSMAYAQLGRQSPVAGLYVLILPLFAFALFGASRRLVVGADSAMMLLFVQLVADVAGFGAPDARYHVLAGVLALVVGIAYVVGGFAKVGSVVGMAVSRSSRVGFMNGVAILIGVSQLPKLFGVAVPIRGTALATVLTLVPALGAAKPANVAFGLTATALILLGRRFLRRVPVALIVVVAGAAFVWAFGLARQIPVIGPIPAGLPSLSWPVPTWRDLFGLGLPALALFILGVSETVSESRAFAAAHGEEADVDADLIGLGAANVAAAFTDGFLLSGSASLSAVADEAKAETQTKLVVAAGMVALVLIAFSEPMRWIPAAALGAVVIAACVRLVDVATMRWLWRVRRSEFVIAAACTVGVVTMGILQGLAIAVALSVGDVLRRAVLPSWAVMGRTPRDGWQNLERYPSAREIPGLVVFRFEAPVFFANAEVFKDAVASALAQVRARHPQVPVRWLVFDAEATSDLDATGAEALGDLAARLRDDESVALVVARPTGEVRAHLDHYGLSTELDDRVFATLRQAVEAYEMIAAPGGPLGRPPGGDNPLSG